MFLCNTSDADWIISIDSQAFYQYLKDKNFKAKTVPRKRRNIIDNYLVSIADQLIKKVLTLPGMDEYISKTASEAEKIFADHFPRIKDTVDKYNNRFYMSNDISVPENLNDYVCTEQTIRIPVSSTPKLLYYYETGINVEAIEGLKNKIREIGSIEYFAEDKDFVRSIVRDLRDVVLEGLGNQEK